MTSSYESLNKVNNPEKKSPQKFKAPNTLSKKKSLKIEFDDNSLLPVLFGEYNVNLLRIEQKLDVIVNSRGNAVVILGVDDQPRVAHDVLIRLYDQAKKGCGIDPAEVDGVIRMVSVGNKTVMDGSQNMAFIKTKKRQIGPRSIQQAAYLSSLSNCDLVFGLGPAGTGKTYLAVAKAVEALMNGKVDRIILSRPAVEAGERLGFLPGDMREKIDPYLRPLYDALYDMLPENEVAKKLESGDIEIAPLAFMRGRTLSNAFVILDEAQNTTLVQMKMFLTRLGENSSMVVTGDLSQVDLPPGVDSGLHQAIEIIEGIKGVGFVRFTSIDVVRHPLVSRIINAYDKKIKMEQYGKKKG
jgi:phosphate starvation-inducible PhoH-like protein